MTRQNGVNKQAYISPAMEVVSIEMEQSILAGSNQGQVETIGVTKEEMLDALLKEYDVSAEDASKDIDEFIGKL